MRIYDAAFAASLTAAREGGIVPVWFFWCEGKNRDTGAAQPVGLWSGDEDITVMARDDAIIPLVQNGEIRLPLFQFNRANGRVFTVVRDILNLRPAHISNLRLCYWLTRAHVDFGCAPAEQFGKDDAAIAAAFRRYIEPEHHG